MRCKSQCCWLHRIPPWNEKNENQEGIHDTLERRVWYMYQYFEHETSSGVPLHSWLGAVTYLQSLPKKQSRLYRTALDCNRTFYIFTSVAASNGSQASRGALGEVHSIKVVVTHMRSRKYIWHAGPMGHSELDIHRVVPRQASTGDSPGCSGVHTDRRTREKVNVREEPRRVIPDHSGPLIQQYLPSSAHTALPSTDPRQSLSDGFWPPRMPSRNG